MQSSRSHGRKQGWDFSPGLQPADQSTLVLGMRCCGQWCQWGQLDGRRCLKVQPELLRETAWVSSQQDPTCLSEARHTASAQ